MLQSISCVQTSLDGFVLCFVLFCLCCETLDIGFVKVACTLFDSHVLGVAIGLVLGCDVHDAIGINVECHLNLRHPTGAGGMPVRSNAPSLLQSLVWARSPS